MVRGVVDIARPNMYEQKIKDKLAAVQGWARNGLTCEQMAKNLGISVTTFYKYQAEKQEFADAIKKGKEVVDFEVENALLKRALGYDYTETREKVENGKVTEIITTVKHVPPDVGAAAFWLKNRKPTEWRDRKEIGAELNGDGRVTFNIMPASLRPIEDEESEG